jgi:hypothetical protein
VLLGALPFFRNEFAVDHLFDLLKADVSNLIGSHASVGDVTKTWVIKLLLHFLFVVLRLLLLQLQ